jgi:co-chaperonin GroES (HSP10)
LDGVIKTYNNNAHSSLGSLSPNEATKDEHIAKIVEINNVKRKYNKTVSDLQIGDKVRKQIQNIFTKGTDPRYSDEVYTVVKTSGKKVILDDDTTNLRYNLLQVPNDTISSNTNVISQIKQK